jgi:hypothetical protein
MKFNYPIFPDREYTLKYDGIEYKVLGSEILKMFMYRAELDKFVQDLDNTTEE